MSAQHDVIDEPPIAGRYELLSRLGRGGMGEVYCARDRSTGREVALKRILGKDAESPRAVTRFRREFHVMARLRHPNVVEVYDYGLDPGGPFYTMELLAGQDLKAKGRMPGLEACGVLREVAAALTFLHSRRLLHRDVSPRNIRCTDSGRAKLMDFGVLATFGVTKDIAGTPPLIAPENVRGLPLDQRADLFGLGALAYWVLTGKHAFNARRLSDLEVAWSTPPPRPSELAEGVPRALDDLVMALLTIDPLGRPRSAVEVVDRLSVIGDLPPLEGDVVHGYVASAPMVGRKAEMKTIRRRAHKAVAGRGSFLIIEAPSGTGKSRLLHEVVFDAQLAGATVASVDCGTAGRGPYGAFRELSRSLLEAAPEEARAAARPNAALLSQIVPELADLVPAGTRAAIVDEGISDPAEIRLRLQGAIGAWLGAVSRRRAIALLVDDVQRCDEASIAVFAALSRGTRELPLLLVAALRTDEVPRFPLAVAALLDAGRRIRLQGLTLEDTETLVRSVFGDVPRTGYLAKWMHDTTGGSPLHLTELCRYVVSRGIVTHHDGMWVLPGQFAEKQVPAALESALDARIAPLSPMGRSLGEALSVHGGELTLPLALALGEGAGGGQQERGRDHDVRVFSAIDDLVQQEVLVGSGDRYRFRHDGLREALLRGLEDERRAALHLRVAEVLEAAAGDDPEREAEIGWHYHHGGRAERGAVLLERAGRRLFEAQALGDAIPPLETALETYRAAGAAPTDHLDLQFMLIVGGALSDRQSALRHADTALAAFQRMSGVSIAVRLGPILGKHIALLAGVGLAIVRHYSTPKSRRGLHPMLAVTRYMLTIGHASYVYFATNDVPGFRSLMRWMAPMNAFRGLGPHGAYNGQLGMLDIMLGRLGDAKHRLTIAADSIMVDRITPTTEFERRLIEAASRGFLVLGGVFQLDPDVDDELARIEELDLRYFDFGAKTAKAIRHRLNGLEDEAIEITREQEATALQLGAGWHLEAMLITYSSLAYALCRDMLGLKRCVEELTRLVDAGFHFRPQLLWASGEYHRERGELDDAERCLDEALADLDDEEGTIRQWTLAALAEVALARGDFEEAKVRAERGLACAEDPLIGQVLPRLKVTRALALAEAALGDGERAERRLAAAIREAEALKNPPLLAVLHEAQARIAIGEGDRLRFEHSRLEVVAAVERTRNPALVALSERLRELGQTPSQMPPAMDEALTAMREAARGAAVTVATTAQAGASRLSDCQGPAERAARALELALDSSTGSSGYLFVLQEDALVLAAPPHAEAPAEVEDAVSSLFGVTVKTGANGASQSSDAESEVTLDAQKHDYELCELIVPDNDQNHIVGAVVILPGSLRYRPPNPRLLGQLARELREAGDVSTGARSLRSVRSS